MASNWISQASSSRSVQLAVTAVASGAFVAVSIFGYQRFSREERVSRLKESIPAVDDLQHSVQSLTSFGTLPKPDPDDIRTEALARRAQNGDYDDEVILEQLARNRVFLRPEGFAKLRKAFVVVVGCGGVGSHCAAALARSGVSQLRLIDFDQVSLSSLNRHAVATLQDVGNPKVYVMQKRLLAIAPWVKFDTRLEKFDGESAQRLLGPAKDGHQPDYIVDAIDNIDTKVALLKYCHDHQLPVVSAMGAGTKSDPTKIMVGDISVTTDDALSRATRRRLKLLGITKGITSVFSIEQAGEGKAELLPLAEEHFQKGKEAVRELGVIQDFRVRILPVLGTMPAVFGYTAANHVILSVSGYPHEYAPAKPREKIYDQIQAAVQSSEEKIARLKNKGNPDVALGLKVPLTLGDISFLVEEIYRGKSAITGVAARPSLIRWTLPDSNTLLTIGEGAGQQKSSILRLSDLVCMTKDEATRHLKEVILGGKRPEDIYDREVLEKVAARRQETQLYEKFR